MALVMLKRSLTGTFCRTPRGKDGKPIGERLEFQPGVPVEVDGEILEALKPDMGKALTEIVLFENLLRTPEEVADIEKRRAKAAEDKAADEKAEKDRLEASDATKRSASKVAEQSLDAQPRSRRRPETVSQD